MFKIDWPCAIGGALVGYYTKGKVENVKTKFRKISTEALSAFKESCEDNPFKKAFQDQNGGNNGN